MLFLSLHLYSFPIKIQFIDKKENQTLCLIVFLPQCVNSIGMDQDSHYEQKTNKTNQPIKKKNPFTLHHSERQEGRTRKYLNTWKWWSTSYFIFRHTKDKKVIGSSTHGFTNGKSFLPNIASAMRWLTWRPLHIEYLNFSMAFETVSHKPSLTSWRSMSWVSRQEGGLKTGWTARPRGFWPIAQSSVRGKSVVV